MPGCAALDPKTVTGGRRDYYLYDGNELTLTLRHGSDGGWQVAQRILSAGIDGALAGRYWTPDAGSPQSLLVLRDRQGTTLGAYRADGTPDPLSWYQPLGAFGAPAGDGSSTSGGKGSATATGFTGAGTPSASGGYVYLRNRWYDPQTGRFLTQDPIGLSGGVNLYAYAGNDPVNFSDPFGLDPCWLVAPTQCRSNRFTRLLKRLAKAELAGFNAAFTSDGMPPDGGHLGFLLGKLSMVTPAPVGGMARATAEAGALAEAAETSFGAKILKQMSRRGWTEESIGQTISNPSRTIETTDIRHFADGTRASDPARAYFNKDGSYVVRNEKTGDVVQISNRNDPNWKSPF